MEPERLKDHKDGPTKIMGPQRWAQKAYRTQEAGFPTKRAFWLGKAGFSYIGGGGVTGRPGLVFQQLDSPQVMAGGGGPRRHFWWNGGTGAELAVTGHDRGKKEEDFGLHHVLYIELCILTWPGSSQTRGPK